MPPRPKRIRWRDLRPHARWLFFIALADFFVFYVVTLILGGDGLSGVEKGGHWFVSSHGRLTEVSHAAWLFTRWQAISLFVLWPAMLVAVAVETLRTPEALEEEEDQSILGRKDAPPRRPGTGRRR